MTRELDELLGTLREDRLDDAGGRRLAELLQDPELRARYVDALLLTGLLHRASAAVAAPVRRARPGRWAAAALAASLIFAFLVHEAPVAALTAASEARWESRAVELGDLGARRLRLSAGLAQITFRSGATAVLQGPADLELQSPERAFLRGGRVVVRVPEGSRGFRLETPTARLLDLGTEFGVSVERDGEALLQVYEGEVVATLKGAADEQRLEGGQAVGIASGFNEVRFRPDYFVRTLPAREDPAGRGPYPYNDRAHEEIQILPAPAEPVLDGDLSDWDLSASISTSCVPPWGENHHVRAAMMYDERRLYVAASVADPFPMRSQVSPHETRELYGMGGGVALRISTDRGAGWPLDAESPTERRGRPLRPRDVNDKLSLLMLWYYAPEDLACLQIKSGLDLHHPRVNPPGYAGAWRRHPDGRGYTVEYAISWDLLGAAGDPPRAGDVLAAMLLAHWSDENGRTWKGQLIDVKKPGETGWNFDRAATWGRAIYR